MLQNLISAFVLIIYATSRTVESQCITANDISVNQSSIEVAQRNIIDGGTQFGLNLLRTLQSNQKFNKDAVGIFFSPYSIWSALMVTYMGSMGATEQELRNVLGLGDSNKIATWDAFKNIRNWNAYQLSERYAEVLNDPSHESYRSANRIYFQEGIAIKDCMREILENEIAFVDFQNKPDDARDNINAWVEQRTEQRIKDLVPPDAVSSLTRMIIANAVYFKETWMQPFDPQKTARRRFTTRTRRDIFVNMMNTRGRFLFGKSEELQCYALELPYTGNALSMVILLPRNRYNGVDILANNLTPQRIRDLLLNMDPREVSVSIPKIKMEDSFELSPILDRMGLRTLFDLRRVDLSGFTGQKEFVVDAVIHKTFIDVNEEGTEAAGATAIISSRSARPIDHATFIADYPFIYFIKDNPSESILFLGTVEKPPEYEAV